jgi:OOP family OmpA-OmpF porin
MKIALHLFFIFVCGFAVAQTNDTLIYAQGKIFNANTKEPITARISYQSLPYGSKVGILNGNEFKFPLFDNEKYSVTVEAPGYAPAKYMLDPAEAKERIVVKDFELGLPVSAAKAAESTRTVGKVMRLDALLFQQGKAKIDPKSFEELDAVAKMLHDNPSMIIQLEGHTDFRGDPKQNLKLSQDRVDAVKTYLLSKNVAKHKVRTKAFGGTVPLSMENTEEAHTENRRVEVRIIEN